jgi:hypothetical protein
VAVGHAVQKHSGDRFRQRTRFGVGFGTVPRVGPIHHSEKGQHRHSRIQLAGRACSPHLFKNSESDFHVASFDFSDFFAERAFEGFVLVRENFHLHRVLQKIIEMVVHQHAQLIDRTGGFR